MGSIKVGSTAIKKVYVGSTAIKKVYVGSTLIWSNFTGLSGSLSSFSAIKTAMQNGGYIYWTPSTFNPTTKVSKSVEGYDGATWTITICDSKANNEDIYYDALRSSSGCNESKFGRYYPMGVVTHSDCPLGLAPTDDNCVFIYTFTKYYEETNYRYDIYKFGYTDRWEIIATYSS